LLKASTISRTFLPRLVSAEVKRHVDDRVLLAANHLAPPGS